jgi:hypothetical protein
VDPLSPPDPSPDQSVEEYQRYVGRLYCDPCLPGRWYRKNTDRHVFETNVWDSAFLMGLSRTRPETR